MITMLDEPHAEHFLRGGLHRSSKFNHKNNDRLNILHFSTSDNEGGSGRSANRIHQELRSRGHTSRMIVKYKTTEDNAVMAVNYQNWLLRYIDGIACYAGNRFGYQYNFIPSNIWIRNHPWVKSADIFQLYNTHGGYFQNNLLAYLTVKSPIVWRMSDFWLATGHCAYPGSCENWRKGCGRCPDLETYPALGHDRTAKIFIEKEKIYNRCSLTLVAPSSWTEKMAKASPLLKRFPIVRIPNGIDLSVFYRIDKKKTREQLGISTRVKTILFCAQTLDYNPRKGAKFLMRALQQVGMSEGVELLLMGIGGESWEDQVPMKIRRLGYHTNNDMIRKIYNCADLLVAPSVLENLPNTVLEAMACEVPVVAFDTGGIRDAVIHGETGYLASGMNIVDLAIGIKTLLNDKQLRWRLAMNSRQRIQTVFEKTKEVSSFEKLYYKLVNIHHQKKK